MSLLNRSSMDTRWPWHHRSVPGGRMLCDVKVWSINNLPETADDNRWDPFNPDPTKRAPRSPQDERLVYFGPASVQPNEEWRARAYKTDGQTDTTHAVSVAIDFSRNRIRIPPEGLYPKPIPGQPWFPVFQTQDRVAVVRVPTAKDGTPLDPQVMAYSYRVRNVNASSNSWTRSLLCDISVSDIGGPYLGD